MREDVDVFPAGDVEQRALRQEVEAGAGEAVTPLADQHLVEAGA
jgi:hypothetical protein